MGVLAGWMTLEIVRVSANGDDAAGDDGPDVQRLGAADERLAFGARIQPHLRYLLLRDVLDHLLADVGRDVERGHVDRARDVEHRAVGFDPFDFGLVRVDRNDRVALLAERPQGAIAELSTIVRGTDDRDDLCHQATSAGACARTNAISRRLPSWRFSIDVAYEMRMNPGASHASPGVTATRDSLSSSSAKSVEVRNPPTLSRSPTSTNI